MLANSGRHPRRYVLRSLHRDWITHRSQWPSGRILQFGEDAVELHLLADWLESPQFPRGIHTTVARGMPRPGKPFTEGNEGNEGGNFKPLASKAFVAFCKNRTLPVSVD